MRSLLIIGCVLGIAVGCGPVAETAGETGVVGTLSPLPGSGVVLRDCAPWDGASYEIRLMRDSEACDATASGDSVIVRVYTTDIAAGDTFDLTDFNVGSVQYLTDAATSPAAVSATLTIDGWRDVDDYARGSLVAVFEDGATVEGTFEALGSCIESVDPPMCG